MHLYSPCDICKNPVDNDVPFHRFRNGCYENYSLCSKHLPRTLRVFIWRHGLRVGRWFGNWICPYGGKCTCCKKCDTPLTIVPSHHSSMIYSILLP